MIKVLLIWNSDESSWHWRVPSQNITVKFGREVAEKDIKKYVRQIFRKTKK